MSLIESSGVRKYLLYSIGETILVVLGILIALQVNNWNERRKFQETEIKLLKEIYEDLNESESDFKQNILGDKEIANKKDIIIRVIEKDLPWHDSLQQHFNYFNYWNSYTIKSTAYNSIEYWGINNISNDGIRRQIINIFQVHVLSLIRNEEEEREIQLATLNDIISTRFDWGEIDRVRPIDYNSFLNNEEFKWRLKTFNAFKRITIRNREAILEEIIKTKDNIKKEIRRLED